MSEGVTCPTGDTDRIAIVCQRAADL